MKAATSSSETSVNAKLASAVKGAKVTLSAKGKRIGRPPSRLTPLHSLPTRCPTDVYTYLKGLAVWQRVTLTAMFEDLIRQFIDTAPWEHGLEWRKPKVAVATMASSGERAATGWQQVNIQLPEDLAQEVEKTAEAVGVSKASFAYTALFWWVQYIHPPRRLGSR